MSLAADLRMLYQLAVAPVRGASHAERLDDFYRAQAEGYDDFRARLLQGREALFRSVPMEAGAVWCDLGGGTAANVECLGDRLGEVRQFYVVDLSTSLLSVARRRIAERGWSNVTAVEADATTFAPSEGAVDVVTCSYSLTMIPEWYRAIDRAWELLRVGGHIGVVDFYVSRKHPAATLHRHGWGTRTLWPAWFALDNVNLSADHLPYLQNRFEPILLEEQDAAIPYVPLVRVPYYRFVGRKV